MSPQLPTEQNGKLWKSLYVLKPAVRDLTSDTVSQLKDELLFPERLLPCCDVFAIQTIEQPMIGLIGAGHKLEESDWSVVGKFNQ